MKGPRALSRLTIGRTARSAGLAASLAYLLCRWIMPRKPRGSR